MMARWDSRLLIPRTLLHRLRMLGLNAAAAMPSVKELHSQSSMISRIPLATRLINNKNGLIMTHSRMGMMGLRSLLQGDLYLISREKNKKSMDEISTWSLVHFCAHGTGRGGRRATRSGSANGEQLEVEVQTVST